MRLKHCMKFKAKTLIIGFLGILISSCNSKSSNFSSESEFLIDSIYSENLSEFRKHNIYLPKGFNKDKKYPIIYATDGNSNLTDKKNVFDSLIDNKIIKPIIFVASFSNTKIADSTSMTFGDGRKHKLPYRYFEYVRQDFPDNNKYPHLEKRFDNHLQYFSKELIPNIEKELNQNIDTNERYFYGVSNGAGFGLSLLNTNPNVIGTYICFSIFGGDMKSKTWNSNTVYPKLYLRYGRSEPDFLKEDAEFLKSKYAEFKSFIEVKDYRGGHNYIYWEKEFIEILKRELKVE